MFRPMFKANPNLLLGGEPELNVHPKQSKVVYDQSRLYSGRLRLVFPNILTTIKKRNGIDVFNDGKMKFKRLGAKNENKT